MIMKVCVMLCCSEVCCDNEVKNVSYCSKMCVMLLQSTVRGKILEGENFGEFGERLAIRQNFPYQYL